MADDPQNVAIESHTVKGGAHNVVHPQGWLTQGKVDKGGQNTPQATVGRPQGHPPGQGGNGSQVHGDPSR